MWKKISCRKRYLIAVLIVLEVFGIGVPVAFAQVSGLASLITNGAGAALGAAISCNKDAIKSGLGSLFGSGNTSDGVTDPGCNGVCTPPTNGTTDGTLDSTPPTTDQTTTFTGNTSSSVFSSDPTVNPGQDLGTASNQQDYSSFAGPVATNPSNDTSGLGTDPTSTVVGASSVPVTNSKIETNTKATVTANQAVTKKLNCTNAIEKAASQTILKQLTVSTVNWINHGFKGNPLYVSDPNSFFKSIGDQTVKKFTSTFGSDSKNYPFGKSLAKEIATELSTSFSDQAKYSLDAVIGQKNPGKTTKDFLNNFSVGGWAAFSSQLDIANNPVGFGFAAKSQVSSDAQNSKKTANDTLTRNHGFFDMQKCVDPADYNPDSSQTSPTIDSAEKADATATNKLAADQQLADSASNQADQADLAWVNDPTNDALSTARDNAHNNLDAATALVQADQKALDAAEQTLSDANKSLSPTVCKKWVTQTPGSVVSSSLNTALATPFKSLENGQDLSTSLTAIFDALTNQLVQKGLSTLTSNDTSNKTPTTGSTTNYNGYTPNVTVDGTSGNGTSFLSAGDAFQTNIFDLGPSGKDNGNGVADATNPTTVTQRTNLVGLINREQQFVATNDKTASTIATNLGWSDSQKAIWVQSMQARDPNYTNILGKQVNLAKRLVPAIYELDFCVPGPHPGWQADASAGVQAFLNNKTKFPQSSNASDLALLKQTPPIEINLFGTPPPHVIGKMPGIISPGSGSDIGDVLGQTVAGILGWIGTVFDPTIVVEHTYRAIVGSYLNISIDPGTNTDQENGYGPSSKIFTTLESRYEKALADSYTTTKMVDAGISPAVIAADQTEWAMLPTYIQTINANNKAIQDTQNMISQLIFLGRRIRNLQRNTPALDGYPSPAPVTYEDYQSQLATIASITESNKLTAYQRELKRINDTFNLIAPDLLSQSDVASQEASLDNISSKLSILAGPDSGSELNQCISDVNAAAAVSPGTANNDGAMLEPLGRVPFPRKLAAYLPFDFIKKFKVSVSFLPDYYYGDPKNGSFSGFPPIAVWWNENPSKVIDNTDVLTIDRQRYPYALSGLEYVNGIY